MYILSVDESGSTKQPIFCGVRKFSYAISIFCTMPAVLTMRREGKSPSYVMRDEGGAHYVSSLLLYTVHRHSVINNAGGSNEILSFMILDVGGNISISLWFSWVYTAHSTEYIIPIHDIIERNGAPAYLGMLVICVLFQNQTCIKSGLSKAFN